jgi:hypothetical protein
MRTYIVDLTSGGRLSELILTQYGDGPKRGAAMALQNLTASGVTIRFGGVGNAAHELLPGQTTILPIGSTKNVEFAPVAVNLIVSIFSER